MRLPTLPDYLQERTRTVVGPSGKPRYVLYWMRTAVRADENPALDVTIQLSNALRVPMFVYHGLSERYPYASDRHHTFILEGARDVAAQLAQRGVGTAFHLEREGHRGPHLATLAADAGLVVTEDMPVAPLSGWVASLAERAPVVLVDTACVVPMRLTKRPDRASRFREHTAALRDARVTRTWDRYDAPAPFVPDLPFDPVDLSWVDVAARVAECDIDHGVGPVTDTKGGSIAGYARWDSFVSDRLSRDARDRNDATLGASSRMSAYLHYGFVSPFRLAREAHERRVDRFVDELLVWRELAYAFCFHVPSHATLDALPLWARKTLASHVDDPRRVLSRETLARARTGDELWDLAQTSLLRHGELHQDVRTTWGKALLEWTDSPEAALATLIDLNHRYALDGRDPASYGGILWCLGLFDRPFEPEAPVRGILRPRAPVDHARRLKVDRYRARVCRPAFSLGPVAVVGAGVAGLACARTLADHGIDVTVFDEGRRVGGRTNRRSQSGYEYDHGAPYLTAKDPRFARYVQAWIDEGVLRWWTFRERDVQGEIQEHRRLVGDGSMRRLAEHLARDLSVRLETHVSSIQSRALVDDKGKPLGQFDRVVVTAPITQARDLLSGQPTLTTALKDADHDPCWCVMASWHEPIPTDVSALRCDGPFAWAARNSSKPGRPEAETWVLHASSAWSESHLEDDPSAVASALLEGFSSSLGGIPEPAFVTAHRWRYARVAKAVGLPCLYDPELGIAVAGDGLLGPRIEAAWLSGVAAAGRILGSAPAPHPNRRERRAADSRPRAPRLA